MADEKIKEFNLVGGTALALRIGHRVSVDIDLFSANPFNADELAEYLKTNYNADQPRSTTNGVLCFINDIKVDLLSHQYPIIGTIDVIEGIRMVSPLDIGAMKLSAIYGNGTRLKDFVDLYALLEDYSLNQLLDACQRKYANIYIPMVKNAVVHHEDIDFDVPIHYVADKEVEWSKIAERLKDAFDKPHLTFGVPEITKKLLKKQREIGKGNNKGLKP